MDRSESYVIMGVFYQIWILRVYSIVYSFVIFFSPYRKLTAYPCVVMLLCRSKFAALHTLDLSEICFMSSHHIAMKLIYVRMLNLTDFERW